MVITALHNWQLFFFSKSSSYIYWRSKCILINASYIIFAAKIVYVCYRRFSLRFQVLQLPHSDFKDTCIPIFLNTSPFLTFFVHDCLRILMQKYISIDSSYFISVKELAVINLIYKRLDMTALQFYFCVSIEIVASEMESLHTKFNCTD